MDSQARKKAIFRAKLNAQKKDKRIDSPLVRYNESDQPVCRVCNVVLKSEALWDAHQVSRKHHEAINNLKAAASGNSAKKHEPPKEVSKPKPELLEESSTKPVKPQLSSGLPPNFFDNNATQKPNSNVETDNVSVAENEAEPKFKVPTGSFAQREASKSSGSESKQANGALPEGFFDNKEADLKARGIKIVKPDVKDEFKEFEKLIQEDLKEVDNRMEEEEYDAAEIIEEEESVEQKGYRSKVELLRKKKLELKEAISAKRSRNSEHVTEKPTREESSSDDDSDEDFAVDWRAQHL